MSELKELLKIRDDTERLKLIEYAPGRPWYMRGRLTLVSGSPLTYANQTGSTVYFSPYVGGFNELNIVLNPILNGSTTLGSAIVTGISSTLQLTPGMTVTGAGIPGATLILTVDSDTQITMTANAGGTAVVALTFGVPANTCIDFWEKESVLRMTLWGASGYGTSARGYVLTSDRGIWYMPGGISERYLGTGRTLAASTIVDGYIYRFLWNLYNPVERSMEIYPGYVNNNAATSFASVAGNWKEIVAGAGSVYWVNGLDRMVQAHARTYIYATNQGAIRVALSYDTVLNTIGGLIAYAANPAAAQLPIADNNATTDTRTHTAGAHSAIMVETSGGIQLVYADIGRGGGEAADTASTFLKGWLAN
jgi:hypothetical protein